uniref:Nucleic acid-binding, OB-fold protein n=1 Tax=Tanacetum cinerariifolium TaxID=118510 RepID=A0A6L2M7R6_TANCI|nr:hypothetical protein [Tanacetum cinerariifolium]
MEPFKDAGSSEHDKGKMILTEPEITNISELSATSYNNTIEAIVYRKWTSKNTTTRTTTKFYRILIDKQCKDHGPQTATTYSYCFKAIVNDGSATTTITCFSNQANTLTRRPDFILDKVFDDPILALPPPNPIETAKPSATPEYHKSSPEPLESPSASKTEKAADKEPTEKEVAHRKLPKPTARKALFEHETKTKTTQVTKKQTENKLPQQHVSYKEDGERSDGVLKTNDNSLYGFTLQGTQLFVSSAICRPCLPYRRRVAISPWI